MALTPNTDFATIGQDIEVETTKDRPSYTYKIDFRTNRIVGFVDGREAMKQAILKIIYTERYNFLIYSWNYGIELNAVFGRSFPVFASEIRRVLTEALLADKRITEIRDFSVTQSGRRSAEVSFTAITIFGEVEITTGVNANV
jgi:hypothetical protein